MPTVNSFGRVARATAPIVPFCASIARRVGTRGGIVAWLVLATPLALDAQARGPATTTSAVPRRCMDTAAVVRPARLDDRHQIYVEQETVVAQRDGRVLVAGAPVFVWKDAGERFDLLAQDSLFGMVIDTSLAVRAIPKPMQVRSFDGMRAAALPDGWWLVAFAEVIPAHMPKRPTVVAMWTGETDGTQWRSLQRLPMIADSLETDGMSALVWQDGRARIAVPFKHDHRRLVVLYALDGGRWSARIQHLGHMSYVALALTPSRDLMAVVRPFESEVEDKNSLFLYVKSPIDSVWLNLAHMVRGGQEPVRDPLFAGDTPRVLSWRRSVTTSGPGDAWFATLSESGDSISTPTYLATGATLTSLASRHGHTVVAIADRAWPNPTLQMLELGDSTVVASHRVTSAYRGLIALTLTPTNVLLVAAQAAASSRDPAVVSVIQTHTWRCP